MNGWDKIDYRLQALRYAGIVSLGGDVLVYARPLADRLAEHPHHGAAALDAIVTRGCGGDPADLLSEAAEIISWLEGGELQPAPAKVRAA